MDFIENMKAEYNEHRNKVAGDIMDELYNKPDSEIDVSRQGMQEVCYDQPSSSFSIHPHPNKNSNAHPHTLSPQIS